MYMSAEMIMTLSAFLTLGIGMFAGFGWMGRQSAALEDRLGARIDRVETSLGARIDKVETSLGARIDKVETSLGACIDRLDTRIDRLDARIDEFARDLSDVKVSVVRIENTRPRLLATK